MGDKTSRFRNIVCGDLNYGKAIAAKAGAFYNAEYDRNVARIEILPDGSERLIGGAIYNTFTHRSINAHMAGFTKNWISRDLLWACFYYPFVQLGCEYIFGQVPDDNPRALALNHHLGYREIARIPDVYDNGAGLIVIRMRRADCRYLKEG